MKIKSIGVIAIAALSFTFMSFSNGSQDLYGDSYLVQTENTATNEVQESVWVAGALRLTAAATRRAVVYTREVTRVAAPALEEAVVQASTVVAFVDNVDKHSKKHNNVIEILKDQKIKQLG